GRRHGRAVLAHRRGGNERTWLCSTRARSYNDHMATLDSFGTRDRLDVNGTSFEIRRLTALGDRVARLPRSLRVLLENLLRREDGRTVTRGHVEALLDWDPKQPPEREIPFMPARVILQDFTGVPCIVDLAAMRDAMVAMGGDPKKINPLAP